MDLYALAASVDGVVVTTPVGLSNKKFYWSAYRESKKKNGCRMPHAAALALLVEQAIKNKTYIDYRKQPIDGHGQRTGIGKYDVIVVFNLAGDPCFGFLRDSDGDDVIRCSTPNGLVDKYI